jgi:hypothetical protein
MNMETYVSTKKLFLPVGLVLGALAAMPMAANADVVNFALADTTAGGLGMALNSTTYGDGGLTATGSSNLSARNDLASEVGLGVCSSNTTGVCSGTGSWNGEPLRLYRPPRGI